ncbi:transcriptional regulator [Clostridium botulinum]|uniref:Transcriptional regulator n=2 Tax=Clostridium TaxID=1485 RepID=A0AAE4FL94_CLOSG|nr:MULTISPECIES: transcriptional regulator [Clostridium]ACA45005.1 conserved domain protein [Clostridium botulinum B1 str. Okra]MBD5564019.1 transcriptional regulator [Clostridium botulinum]MBD5566610.1 transcriptional regulator [Clostridium botulinum]MBD5568874.1 transcriptional regulator [Clostridium botulinum]MBD5572859.1 transcriptional regulator [Clostridium botulinum]
MSNHITELRKNAGFNTVKNVTSKLEISDSMMYQIEGGYKKPSPNLAIKMSKLFNCTMEDIFLPYGTTNSDKLED